MTKAEFNALATYNAECARGLMHTKQWIASMVALQRKYDQWAKEQSGNKIWRYSE